MKTIILIWVLLTFGTTEYQTLKLQELTVEEITRHELQIQKDKFEKQMRYMDKEYFRHN